MKTPKQFVFKTEKKAGINSSPIDSIHLIKLQGKEVGSISDDYQDHKIRLMVKKEPIMQDPAPFRTAYLKASFPTVLEAKKFLKANFDEIITKFDLYQLKN